MRRLISSNSQQKRKIHNMSDYSFQRYSNQTIDMEKGLESNEILYLSIVLKTNTQGKIILSHHKHTTSKHPHLLKQESFYI